MSDQSREDSLTLHNARVIVARLGFTLRKRDGEFRLCPRGGSEMSAYYTDDLQDAIDTARNWR